MNSLEDLLLPLIAIICSVGLPTILGAYVLAKQISSNHKVRFELAKQGIIPPRMTKPSPNKYRSLRNGMLCIGISLGLIVSILFSVHSEFEGFISFLLVSASVVMGMGIAYTVFYFISNNKRTDTDEE